jgi:hypothetical protein
MMKSYSRRLQFLFCLLLLGPWFALNAEGSSRSNAAKPACLNNELRLKTCNLKSGSLQLDIQNPKMIVHDGAFVHVTPLPPPLQSGDWKGVRILKLGEHTYLEFLAWVPTQQALPVRDLHWVVVAMKGAKGEFVIDEVVQHEAAGKDEKPVSYGLKLQNNKVLWQSGLKSGEIPTGPSKTDETP